MAKPSNRAIAAAILTLMLFAGSARSEMIHWDLGNLYPATPIPAYTILPHVTGGMEQRIITGGLYFGGTNGYVYAGSAIAPLNYLVLTGKGFFDNGGSQPLIADIHDQASNSDFEVRTSVVVNGGAMDASTGISTVKLSIPFGDRPTTSTLGQAIYSVRFDLSPFVWHPDRLQLIGTINADVTVSPVPTSPTPEPSCLALVGTGLATVAGAAWRKWRRAVAL